MDTPRSPEEPFDPQSEDGADVAVRERPRKRWIVLPLVAAAALVGGVVLSQGSAGAPPEASPTTSISAVAAPSSSATPQDTAAQPTATPVAADAGPAAAQPVGLSFAAAGIDMAVLPLTPSDEDLATQSLVPPLTIDAYWLTPYGVPGAGSQNTTYIAGHSWDGQDAPFNHLSDESLVGKEFTLTTEEGELTYVVDGVVTHDKDTLKDSEIWDVVPNRVVLISCYTEDPWGKNVVVTAMPRTA
ncbi:hypothetical protein AC792_07055 [Arthrobacter sp. RIT-PI-e]|uniref:class F sortase n=1 Tax=Arthrobacter sp. RIT-PI-e TaxID=1681197 RepID=UPI00067678B0|nr:class F sortase [Arthrobacter sp. RIT-PI-e]KNC19330.1 hypothetical protein AC792_07055 [Arthrobacter sp. RIT-PI-e]